MSFRCEAPLWPRLSITESLAQLDCANLQFRVVGQKAVCDGPTHLLVYTNSCAFWKETSFN